MSKLFIEGHNPTLTLSNTKGIDILLSTKAGKLYRIEVKSTANKPKKWRMFHNNQHCYYWRWMDEKHENIIDDKLIYAFVWFEIDSNQAKLFLVPNKDVAKYVKWEHKHWLNSEHKKPIKGSSERVFRIPIMDSKKYENNFSIFR